MKEILKNISLSFLWKKNIESDKDRDHCHLTGIYKGPSRSKCNINVTQDQSNFIPFIYHSFSI